MLDKVTDFGQGVYYFPTWNDATFGETLSAFLKANSQLEVTAVVAWVQSSHTHGYYVTFREIENK